MRGESEPADGTFARRVDGWIGRLLTEVLEQPESRVGDYIREVQGAYGEVDGSFTVTRVPAGGMPEEVRQAWVGLELPLREGLSPGESGEYVDLIPGEARDSALKVPVLAIDGLAVLYAHGRTEATEVFAPFIGFPFLFNPDEGEIRRGL
jgi:hypothetical protein